MQTEPNATEAQVQRQVELRIVDPQLRHRIARALQRAGVGASAVEGPIRVALRRDGLEGAGFGRMVELSGNCRSATLRLAGGDERVEAILGLDRQRLGVGVAPVGF